MKIKKCEITDIKEIYNLICELKDEKLNYEKFMIAFNSKVSDNKNYCLLCVDENNIIGFLNLNIDYQLHHIGKVATIEELIVNSEYRNNGVGKLLLDNAINYAKNNDCEVIELTSGFSRERAHNFYMKNGFKKSSYKFKIEF